MLYKLNLIPFEVHQFFARACACIDQQLNIVTHALSAFSTIFSLCLGNPGIKVEDHRLKFVEIERMRSINKGLVNGRY